MRYLHSAAVVLSMLLCAPFIRPARAAVPETVSFQGLLTSPNGQPVADTDGQTLTFRLYDAPTGGTLLWSQTSSSVQVHSGAFSDTLDFSTGFTAQNTLDTALGGTPYVEVQAGTDPPMTPRLPLGSAPYALNAWSVGGNTGMDPATQFLGTVDNRPMELRVDNQRVLRLEPASGGSVDAGGPNIVGGYAGNTVAPGVQGATVFGGVAGKANTVNSYGGVVAGGAENYAGNGPANVIYATVGGGEGNRATESFATVAGGYSNTASSGYAVVSGGRHNTASGDHAAVSGGVENEASGESAAVSGGASNRAGGDYSTILGGFQNLASAQFSLAAGRRAKAINEGSFVWGDLTESDFTSTKDNSFIVRATGGVGLGTASPTNQLSVYGSADISGMLGVGTANPTAKLDVNGTVKATGVDVSGTVKSTGLQITSGASPGRVLTSDADGVATWQAPAISAISAIVAGEVEADGQTILNGSGFTVERWSERPVGGYHITFTTPFLAKPVVTATGNAEADALSVTYWNVTKNDMDILATTPNGFRDTRFSFIAVGAR
jgi:hypothetical protein